MSSSAAAPLVLYRDALHCVFPFLSRVELASSSAVNQQWRTAVNSMRPLSFSFTARDAEHALLASQSPLFARHVGALTVSATAAGRASDQSSGITPAQLALLSSRMSSLHTLRVTLWYDGPIGFDANGDESDSAIPATEHQWTLPSSLLHLHLSLVSTQGQLQHEMQSHRDVAWRWAQAIFTAVGEIKTLQSLRLRCGRLFSHGMHSTGCPSPPLSILRPLQSLAALTHLGWDADGDGIRNWPLDLWMGFRSGAQPNLTELDVVAKIGTDALAAFLADAAPRLTMFTPISSMRLTAEHIPLLQRIESTLQTFEPNEITDSVASLDFLRRMPQLTNVALSLHDDSPISPEAMVDSLSHCPLIRTLGISHIHATDAQLAPLWPLLTQLTDLSLAGMEGIRSLEFLSTHAHLSQQLRRLSLVMMYGLDDAAMEPVFTLRALEDCDLLSFRNKWLSGALLDRLTPGSATFEASAQPRWKKFEYQHGFGEVHIKVDLTASPPNAIARSPPAPPASPPAVAVSAAPQLYRDALHCVLPFLSIVELASSCAVNHQWRSAVSSMRPLDHSFTARDADHALVASCSTVMARHVSSLSIGSTVDYNSRRGILIVAPDAVSPAQLALLSAGMTALRTLRCTLCYDGPVIEGDHADDLPPAQPYCEWIFPASLRQVEISLLATKGRLWSDEPQHVDAAWHWVRPIFAALGEIKSLQSLRLRVDCMLSRDISYKSCPPPPLSILRPLQSLPVLTHLAWKASELTWWSWPTELWMGFREQTSLTELDVDAIIELDSLSAFLAEPASRLTLLTPISKVTLADEHIPLLVQLPALQTFNPAGITESISSLDFLTRMPQLTNVALVFPFDSPISPDSMVAALAHCPLIRALRLDNIEATDAQLAPLWPLLTRLTDLTLLCMEDMRSLDFLSSHGHLGRQLRRLRLMLMNPFDASTLVHILSLHALEECNLCLFLLWPLCSELLARLTPGSATFDARAQPHWRRFEYQAGSEHIQVNLATTL